MKVVWRESACILELGACCFDRRARHVYISWDKIISICMFLSLVHDESSLVFARCWRNPTFCVLFQRIGIFPQCSIVIFDTVYHLTKKQHKNPHMHKAGTMST